MSRTVEQRAAQAEALLRRIRDARCAFAADSGGPSSPAEGMQAVEAWIDHYFDGTFFGTIEVRLEADAARALEIGAKTAGKPYCGDCRLWVDMMAFLGRSEHGRSGRQRIGWIDVVPMQHYMTRAEETDWPARPIPGDVLPGGMELPFVDVRHAYRMDEDRYSGRRLCVSASGQIEIGKAALRAWLDGPPTDDMRVAAEILQRHGVEISRPELARLIGVAP